jgi:hypothetical protein
MSQAFDVGDIPYWAAEPWWEQPAYARHPPYPADAVRAAVENMRRYFDLDWWRVVISTHRRNVVAANLIGRGSIPLAFIYDLGTTIGLLENASGFQAKMRELKEGDKSASVLFEIQIAGILARAGLDVQFPKEGGGKSPDITVAGPGGRAAVECKRLECQDWEQWAHALAFSILRILPTKPRAEMVLQIELDPDLSNILMGDDTCHGWNVAITRALTARVEQAVHETMLANSAIPADVDVPGIARVHLGYTGSTDGPKVTGIPSSPTRELRRILTNGLLNAATQIGRDVPGVVVVHCEHLPDAALARVVFDTAVNLKLTGLDNVAALFILPTRYLFDSRRPLLVLNSRYPQPAGELEVVRVLTEAFQPTTA